MHFFALLAFGRTGLAAAVSIGSSPNSTSRGLEAVSRSFFRLCWAPISATSISLTHRPSQGSSAAIHSIRITMSRVVSLPAET